MFFEPFPKAGYLDQFAHALVGFLSTMLFMYIGFIWWQAIGLTMLVAFVREMIQHPFKISAGSRTDLFFWFVGCAIGAYAYSNFIGVFG